MFNSKVILVTGGTGSFGKAFINYLLSSDEENNYSLDKYEINSIGIKIGSM